MKKCNPTHGQNSALVGAHSLWALYNILTIFQKVVMVIFL
jgi:hypothetical protein